MSSRRLGIVAVSDDVLSDQDIRDVDVPSWVKLWASSVTNGDLLGLRLNKTIMMDDGEVNTIAGDIIDVSTDQLIFDMVVGAGKLKAPVPTLTTELQLLLSVEPILDLSELMS